MLKYACFLLLPMSKCVGVFMGTLWALVGCHKFEELVCISSQIRKLLFQS
jgi:hypothetical protein